MRGASSPRFPESYAGRVLDGMVCAGDGRTDACRGDSGGPLVVTDEMNSYVGGVVSWGDGCGQANKFGVYTSVLFFAEWLRQYLEQ
ncbi:trypsin-like serine protease [Cystobacter fuscus]